MNNNHYLIRIAYLRLSLSLKAQKYLGSEITFYGTPCINIAKVHFVSLDDELVYKTILVRLCLPWFGWKITTITTTTVILIFTTS